MTKAINKTVLNEYTKKIDDLDMSELMLLSVLIDDVLKWHTPQQSDGYDDTFSDIVKEIFTLKSKEETGCLADSLIDYINNQIVRKISMQSNEADGIKSYNEMTKHNRNLARFVIKEAKSGFYFILKSPNGELVATSDLYSRITSCFEAIDSVKTNSDAQVEDNTTSDFSEIKYPKYIIYLDRINEYRFRLHARNGSPIIASEGYTRKDSCENAIGAVKKFAKTAIVERK